MLRVIMFPAPMLRVRLSHALCALVAFATMSAGAAPAATRPNIVLIMTDDQGYGDLGATGNPILDTPHIDALASRSATMSSFYVSPVCAPTRASLMTGRYNYRTRVVDTFKGRAMMDPEEVTVAELLRSAGYRTGIFGKWHLGDCYPMRPMDQGFEESLVHRGGGLAQPSEPIASARRYTDPILIHNGEEVETKGYCTDLYFDAALDFIEKSHNAGQPFFVYLPPNSPHGPFHDVPRELYEKYRKQDLAPVLLGNAQSADTVARVYAMVENIDQNVGRLTRKLEDLGLTQNTLIIFMVDNGPNTRRYVGPFRGMKSEVHQGGIRSPFFIQWPDRFKPGASSDHPVAHIDVMPTLLEAAGVTPPRDLRLDGRSFLPLLKDPDAAWPDRILVWQTHRGNVPERFHHMAIRDARWMLVHPTGFGRETMPPERPFELYDLIADPGQTNNLAARHPEQVVRLKQAYEAWFEEVSHTRPDNFAPPRIVAGTDHETRTVLTWEDWRVEQPEGWGRNGRWLMTFASDQTYDVEFLWPEVQGPGMLEFRVGAVRRSVEVPSATARVVLKNVRIPTGDAALSGALQAGDKEVDLYHVVLNRRAQK